ASLSLFSWMTQDVADVDGRTSPRATPRARGCRSSIFCGDACGAEERRLRIENHADRDLFHHRREASLLPERLEERAVLELREDLRGDAAADVNAARRDDHQREIAGHRAV